jgi:hypothetical protein
MNYRLCRRAILSGRILLVQTELTWIHRDGPRDAFIRLKLL